VPTLDSTTGAFQADLRLFRVADPTGQFAGLSNEGIQVGLSYTGASVQPITGSSGFTFKKRELHSLISWTSTKRYRSISGRSVQKPALTQSYAFSGTINGAMMMSNMTTEKLESLVLPTVTLTAMTAQNVPAFMTALDSKQATFLVGAFSQKDEANAQTTTATATTGTTPVAVGVPTSMSTVFVLPGTKILIFPIGAIITGIWTLLGVGVVMWGTLGRIQFRDQYRRQTARANAAHVTRI